MYLLTVFLTLMSLSFAESTERRFFRVCPQNASIEEYPFQASVIRNKIRLCGAVIVAPHYVITTAHCVYMEPYNALRVRVGSASRIFRGTLYDVKNLFFNDDPLTSKQLQYDLDIAVVELKLQIFFTEGVQPIAIVPEKEDQGEIATLVGWEYKKPTAVTWRGPEEDEFFQKLRLPLINRQICTEVFKKNFTVTDNMICAGGSSKCILRHNRGYGAALINDKMQLIGILTFTDTEHRVGYPYVFTRIGSPEVQSFINTHVFSAKS